MYFTGDSLHLSAPWVAPLDRDVGADRRTRTSAPDNPPARHRQRDTPAPADGLRICVRLAQAGLIERN
jgi:hypothetical protein